MKKQFIPLLFWVGICSLSAQSSFNIERNLSWADAPRTYVLADGTPFDVWKFDGCTYGDEARSLPVFFERFAISGPSEIDVTVLSVQWEAFVKKATEDDNFLSNELIINALNEQERSQFFGRVKFIPIRKVGSSYERAVRFTLSVRVTPKPLAPTPAVNRDGFTFTSVLNSGDIYKFGVAQNGLYKLDYAFLKNELGISNLDNIE